MTKFYARKLLTLIAALSVLFTLAVPVAAETPPVAISLPSSISPMTNIRIYEENDGSIRLAYSCPKDVYEFKDTIDNLYYYGDENGNKVSDDFEGDTFRWSKYGAKYINDSVIQFDVKIDDGDWQYISDWDTEPKYDYYFSTDLYLSMVDSFQVISSAYLSDDTDYTNALKACYKEISTGDGETKFNFDKENYSLSFRTRYIFKVQDEISGNENTILSNWSDIITYGGSGVSSYAYDLPTELEKPEISLYDIFNDSSSYPNLSIYSYASDQMLKTSVFPDQYDHPTVKDTNETYLHLVFEASTDGGKSWLSPDFYYGSVNGYPYYNIGIYDLWQILYPDDDIFEWTAGDILLRAYYSYSILKFDSGDEPYTLKSDPCEPITVHLDGKNSYNINIIRNTENNTAITSDAKSEESFFIIEGSDLYSIDGCPVPGCYVQTVTVNDEIYYNRDDETTYSKLYWNGSDEPEERSYFEFIGDEAIVSKNLNIVFTYGGTPSAKVAVTCTTENEGGGFYPTPNSDGKIEFFSGENAEISFVADNDAFAIEKVLIDGVENAQAAKDGYFVFENIDAAHTIAVTYKRVAYYINYNTGGEGDITVIGAIDSEYPYYFATGSTATYTFVPEEGYELLRVDIDGVPNEKALADKSFAFSDVNADHEIYALFSTDTPNQYNLKVTCGEHGKVTVDSDTSTIIDKMYNEGDNVRITFVPDEGYILDTLTIDEVIIENPDIESYSITISNERDVVVTFKPFVKTYKRGDINLDDEVNAADALLALQSSVGKIALPENQFALGELNGDNTVNAADALLILQFSVGKIAVL